MVAWNRMGVARTSIGLCTAVDTRDPVCLRILVTPFLVSAGYCCHGDFGVALGGSEEGVGTDAGSTEHAKTQDIGGLGRKGWALGLHGAVSVMIELLKWWGN